MTKEVSHWPEVHQLIQFVTKHMGEIKELARPGDREKESLDLEKIYLDFQPQDFDGASLMLRLFLDSDVILPIYSPNAFLFLTQIRDVKTRRSIGVQMYCYLMHIRSVLTKESEIKEWEGVKKGVLQLIRRTPRGDVFCDAVVKHIDREKVWEDWKERKLPPMIPSETPMTHEVVKVTRTSRTAEDLRNLCRDDILKDFVEDGFLNQS